jgi:metal transporter CNNM
MWIHVIIVISLVLLSGMFAGLTLALFSIKLTSLERKIRLGDQQAKKVYQIRKNGNLLLCTLLLGNVTSYTTMAIFLGSITSGVIAGFVATALIFVFGEILPQAVFPRYAMQISASLAWLVKITIVLFYPVAAPIAWVLDRILGKEPPVLWSKDELQEIIKYHEDMGDGIIDEDEERIILGALSFSEMKVESIMIPLESAFFLESPIPLNRDTKLLIKEKGHSRVPVLHPECHQAEGILYLKDLVFLEDETQTAGDLCRSENLITVQGSMMLDTLLNVLVSSKMHMALVLNEQEKVIGIATFEDIMEEILKTELEDKF